MIKTTINVNRLDFIAWTQGNLLERDVHGRVVVGDHIDHERAQKALDAGKSVGLLVNGELVSILRRTSEGYVEEKIET